MLVTGPERYEISYTPEAFTVLCPKGKPRFSGIANSRNPKLYVASIEGMPVYVGATVRAMGRRLYDGWKATGKTGYHGYAWRNEGSKAALDIWEHSDATIPFGKDMETVEAEVVFRIRQAGQWPAFQTEIHFYPSTEEHRRIATEIAAHYGM